MRALLRRFSLYLPLVTLAACNALPTNDATVPPATEDYQSRWPEGDPFAEGKLTDQATPTKFKPELLFEVSSLKAGEAPNIAMSIYQSKGELEIRETQTLVENARFAFDTLTPGKTVGFGKMEVGTPPKLTLDITIAVTSTDRKESAQLSVKASSPFAKVYLADLQVKQLPGGLSIISIGNATRANNKNGVASTVASARVSQTFYPGLVQLPAAAGPMRTRTVIISEPDPGSRAIGQKVFRQDFTIE